MEKPIFSITEKAKSQILNIIQSEANGDVLSISIHGYGCNGLSYSMSIVRDVKDSHVAIDCSGIKVSIDKKSILFMKGTELDFSDGLDGKGFTFNNPNAKSVCGCGSSFGM